MKRFLALLLTVIIMIAWNNAAFGCNCSCIPQEETVVEEMVTEEATEEITVEEVPVEEALVAEETQATEECEAFEATIFEYTGTYSDTMALEYEEPVVVEEETAEEETIVEGIPTIEETPAIEEVPVEEETPAEEESPVTKQIQQKAVATLEAVEEAVEETVEAAKPVVDAAKTAYVQTGCDQLVSAFMMQLCVMLASIIALSVLLNHAVKQEK